MDQAKPEIKTKPSLTIWVITDNKPGHRNQLQGLINALSLSREISTRWISVSSRWHGAGGLINCSILPWYSSQPDMLLAAGHQTHLLLLAYKRCLKKPAIVLMKPSFPLAWFDLCFIPRHDQPPVKDNVVETIGPVNKVIPSKLLEPERGLILIGGTSRHFSWSSANVIKQISRLIKRLPGVEWQVVTSRRTPYDFTGLLARDLPELKVIIPSEVGTDWLAETMQLSGNIWVTEDSVSMLFEAITSGANVGILQLSPGKPTRVSREIERLLAEKRISTLDKEADVSLAQLDEARRCADLLVDKLDL